MDCSITVPVALGQKARNYLQKHGCFDGKRRLKKRDGDLISVPVLGEKLNTEELAHYLQYDIVINRGEQLHPSKKACVSKPFDVLVQNLRTFLQGQRIHVSKELWDDVPCHWEKHGDLVLLPDTGFTDPVWKTYPGLWDVVCQSLHCQRLAKKSVICGDGMRTPQVEILCGTDGWVLHKDNGISYTYDVTRCMFSAGNITEKMRVAKFDCSLEVVVDLYAGIGYFTLPYLVHAQAKHVHACEWNPNSVEALRRNLQMNHVADRCTIHKGDNRQVCPRGVADRVNLGLIPSSEDSWPVACAALKPSGGILHVHANITCKPHTDKDLPCPHGGKHSVDTDHLNAHTVGTFDSSKSQDNTEVDYVNSHSDVKTSVTKFHSQVENLSTYQKQQTNVDGENDRSTGKPGCACDHAMQDKADDQDEGMPSFSNICPSCATASKENTWKSWSLRTCDKINKLCEGIHGPSWASSVLHVEHVKSYAPHVDHIVVDIECRPKPHHE